MNRTRLIVILFCLLAIGCSDAAGDVAPEPTQIEQTPVPGTAGVEATATAPAATALPSPTLAEPTIAASATPTVTPEATTTPTPSPTPTAVALVVTGELTFEMVAHEGGEVRSVAVDGNIAYVGVGPRLVALDVSNPGSPRQIGRSAALPGLVDALVLANDGQQTRVYAGAGGHVAALTLGAEGEIAVEGVVAMPGIVRALALEEGLLYAGGIVLSKDANAEDSGFIAVVDVQQPAVAGFRGEPGRALSGYVVGSQGRGPLLQRRLRVDRRAACRHGRERRHAGRASPCAGGGTRAV